MALGKCKECGKEASSEAATCPHCGVSAPVRYKPNVARGRLILAVLGVIAILAIMGHFGSAPPADTRSTAGKDVNPYDAKAAAGAKPASKALAKPVDDPREIAFQKTLLLVRAVKASMNDPGSLEIFEANASDTAVEIGYRGKNAFGALIVNYAIVTNDGKSANGTKQNVAVLWNKHIANRSLIDLTGSIQGAKSLGAY
jgi:hypothetical protein